MEKVKIGVIGLGRRGYSMIRDVILAFDDAEVVALCDVCTDRVEAAADLVKKKRGTGPFRAADFRELLEKGGADAVYIATDWGSHTALAVESMKRGVIAGVEVGGAYGLDECFALVDTYEKTKTPVMLMENCCFGKDELLATAMARDGLFGEIVYCHGCYGHDLREEVARGNLDRHYRLRNYLSRDCENYPTHELGPIAKLLGINRGNRFLSLVSVSSKAAGLRRYIEERPGLVEKDPALAGAVFGQGDIVNTIITCEGGEQILIRLDTTLPRSYDREFTVRGTKGSYCQTTNSVFLDGDREYWEPAGYVENTMNNARGYEEKYLPDEWKHITDAARAVSHGGMDGIMFRVFLDRIKSGGQMPVDVYDMACWMAVTPLSAASIAAGGAPQPFPDFTKGRYASRKIEDVVRLNRTLKSGKRPARREKTPSPGFAGGRKTEE